MALMLLALLASTAAEPTIIVRAQPRPVAGAIVPDAELDHLRGGLRLPNGLDVSIGIDIQTRLNGMLVLHTVYASEGVATGIRVFRDGEKPVSTAPATKTIETGATMGIPLLVVDRSPTGTTIIPSAATAPTTVNLVQGDQSTWLSGEGQTQIPVATNGAAAATPDGEVRLTQGDNGTVVSLQSPTLLVQQLLGRATGVVVTNTANNQVIDTISAVNVDVRGLTPELLSGLFTAQRAVLDAVTNRP